MMDRIIGLDGGMGTTLESLGHDVSGPMWGSELLLNQPEVIAEVHRRWSEAGAELVETATYQMTLPSLARTCTPIEAGDLMARAINLAHSGITPSPLSCTATSGSCSTSKANSPAKGVVLSLGPFGASLVPSQEYAGIYPPPYGPTIPSGLDTPLPNFFPSTADGRIAESQAEALLTQWHLDRLQAFRRAGRGEAWNKLRWLAFETVPLLVEIRAIRRAMGILRKEMRSEGRDAVGKRGDVMFWITSPFPSGRHPQLLSTGENVTMEDFVQAVIGDLSPLPEGAWGKVTGFDGTSEAAAAEGIGINCTAPAYISTLFSDLTSCIANNTVLEGQSATRAQPTLVLYPDGGAVYDTTTKTWTNRSQGAEEWARDVAKCAKAAAEARRSGKEESDVQGQAYVWDKVIVGGCCKAGFDEIRALRRELSQS